MSNHTSRNSDQSAASKSERDATFMIRRFPRTKRDHEIGKLLMKVKIAHRERNFVHMRMFLNQIVNKIDQSFSTSDVDCAGSWYHLPRFDPSAVNITRWLIDAFVAEGSIQLVVGDRGAFKTTLMLFAARSVAGGEEFLGRKTRRRRVLYLDYENPVSVIKARNADLKLNLPHNKNLVIWNRFHDQPAPRPDDSFFEEFVKRCLLETGHGPWIIFDSWASLLRPGEGGEFTGQIAPIYNQLRRLVDMGATVSMLDHTRKYDKGTTYGGQDKEAKADSIHTMIVYKGPHQSEGVIAQVESWLKRFAPEGEGSFAFEVQSRQDRHGNWHIVDLFPAQDPIAQAKLKNIEILRKLIRQNPNSGQEALASAAMQPGLSRDQAIKLLKDGDGKHWRVRRTIHNKTSYSLI